MSQRPDLEGLFLVQFGFEEGVAFDGGVHLHLEVFQGRQGRPLGPEKKTEKNEILLFDRKYSVRIDVPFQIIILLLQGSDVFVKLIFDGLDLYQLSLQFVNLKTKKKC